MGQDSDLTLGNIMGTYDHNFIRRPHTAGQKWNVIFGDRFSDMIFDYDYDKATN